MAEDSQLTEESMRLALERLGGGQRRPAEGAGHPSFSVRSGASARAGAGKGTGIQNAPAHTQRRRRFVGDGQVLVEHQSLGRSRTASASARPQPSSEEQDELERLRLALRREQRRAHDAEIEIAALQSRVRSLETGNGHLHVELDAMTKKLEERDQEVRQLQVQQQKSAPSLARRPVGRPPKVAVPVSEVPLASVQPPVSDRDGKEGCEETGNERQGTGVAAGAGKNAPLQDSSAPDLAAQDMRKGKTPVEPLMEEEPQPVQWWRD